jgi:hypothetical protein
VPDDGVRDGEDAGPNPQGGGDVLVTGRRCDQQQFNVVDVVVPRRRSRNLVMSDAKGFGTATASPVKPDRLVVGS